MPDRPIIFSAPMVRALLDGRKTQTRRVLNPQPAQGAGISQRFCDGARFTDGTFSRCRFEPGDRLWVREAIDKVSEPGAVFYRSAYEAAFGNTGAGLGWKSAIHMPRWASRLTLIVTEVRVQRLQEISEADAVEDAGIAYAGGFCLVPGLHEISSRDQRSCFRDLWNSLHGPGAWDANPWVAAITFTVHRGNIDGGSA